MGNSAGGLMQGPTTSHGKSYHTKCICLGCGCSDQMCAPALASDLRCCCLEVNMKVDPSLCQQASQLCIARMGCKLGPAVVDVTNPLVDKDELVVVVEKKLLGC
eukprot:gb/GFBE01046826.1/.p1 GENE.gb/GFBE01046826.1/~~gb/GFBE01046826.1/.p1  ORF type:complete len:104 (+),score=26.22 gb/GFBE01046826.1/:1-312(+)